MYIAQPKQVGVWRQEFGMMQLEPLHCKKKKSEEKVYSIQ